MVLFFCLTTLQNWQNCPAALTNHSGFLSIQLGFFRTSRGGANNNADAMLYLPGGGAMLFLIDVDHGSFEKAKVTRQINLQAATVSLQVVISLCKRKETAALKLSFKTAD